jgi:hypothetical protein
VQAVLLLESCGTELLQALELLLLQCDGCAMAHVSISLLLSLQHRAGYCPSCTVGALASTAI